MSESIATDKSEKINTVQQNQAISLTELQPGILARVERIEILTKNTESDRVLQRFSQRLEAMGILRDRPIEVLRKAEFGGPLHIRVGQTTELAIRQEEAKYIKVIGEL